MLTSLFGELPVIGTLRQCENTARGWQGIKEDGSLYMVRYDPARAVSGTCARIPEDNYIVHVENRRDVNGILHWAPVGVMLLERKRKKLRGSHRKAD